MDDEKKDAESFAEDLWMVVGEIWEEQMLELAAKKGVAPRPEAFALAGLMFSTTQWSELAVFIKTQLRDEYIEQFKALIPVPPFQEWGYSTGQVYQYLAIELFLRQLEEEKKDA